MLGSSVSEMLFMALLFWKAVELQEIVPSWRRKVPAEGSWEHIIQDPLPVISAF